VVDGEFGRVPSTQDFRCVLNFIEEKISIFVFEMDQPKRRSAQQGPVDLIQCIDECPSMDLVSSRNEISGEQDRSAGLCGALAQVFLSSVTRY
jgi:hypothetical protein